MSSLRHYVKPVLVVNFLLRTGIILGKQCTSLCIAQIFSQRSSKNKPSKYPVFLLLYTLLNIKCRYTVIQPLWSDTLPYLGVDVTLSRCILEIPNKKHKMQRLTSFDKWALLQTGQEVEIRLSMYYDYWLHKSNDPLSFAFSGICSKSVRGMHNIATFIVSLWEQAKTDRCVDVSFIGKKPCSAS